MWLFDKHNSASVNAFQTMLSLGVVLDQGRRYPKTPGVMLERLTVEQRIALSELRAIDINDIRKEDLKLWVYDESKQQTEELKTAFRLKMKCP